MEWFQTLSIMGTVLGSAYFIHKDIRQEIKDIRDEIKTMSDRTDRLYETSNARSDKLYEMFIDLLKERRND